MAALTSILAGAGLALSAAATAGTAVAANQQRIAGERAGAKQEKDQANLVEEANRKEAEMASTDQALKDRAAARAAQRARSAGMLGRAGTIIGGAPGGAAEQGTAPLGAPTLGAPVGGKTLLGL